VAATPLDTSLSNVSQVQRTLENVAVDYEITIAAAVQVREKLKNMKSKDARLYWHLGAFVQSFLSRLHARGFYLVQQNATLGTHLGMSASSIKKVLGFYRRFGSTDSLNPNIPWQHYRNNNAAALAQSRTSETRQVPKATSG